jgi:hypothetical protein
MDGRSQHVAHGQLAKTGVQGEPPVHATGYGDRQRSERGYFAVSLPGEILAGQFVRRPPARVQAVEFFVFSIPDDGEQIAADSAAGRLHQPQGRVGGDGCVHRAAPAQQNVHRDLGGQRMTGRGHPVSRDHFRPGGKGPAGDAVATECGVAHDPYPYNHRNVPTIRSLIRRHHRGLSLSIKWGIRPRSVPCSIDPGLAPGALTVTPSCARHGQIAAPIASGFFA